MEWMWWLLQTAVMLYQEYNLLKNFKCKFSKFNDKKKPNMINQIKAVMFVQDAERKAWLGILQKQRCPVFPVTTRNRAEQAQHGRWLFKITRVGGSCAGCPQLRLSPHARPLLRASRAAKLSKFSRQEQTGRGGFPAAVNPTRGGK